MKREILRMSGICQSENGREIVRDGAIYLFQKEIIGIVGKSNVGKSALIGALTGEYPCDTGMIWIAERKRKISSVEQSRREGVFLIKDESSLVEEFTIRDTMKLNFAFVGKRIKYSEYSRHCMEILEFLGIEENADVCIGDLDFHERVLIEMAQALICNVRILVFDNVISLLPATIKEQIRKLFVLLKEKGISIILIENQVDYIKEYIARLYVIRRGIIVAMLREEEIEGGLILSLMEGQKFVPKEGKLKRIEKMNRQVKALEFRNVHTRDQVIRDLSFVLYEKECLGVWNRNRHSGKGIIDILSGEAEMDYGEISVHNRACRKWNSYMLKRYGIVVIPEEEQLFSNMNIGENIMMAALWRNSYGGILPKEGELRYLVQELCGEYMANEGNDIFPAKAVPNSALMRKKVALCRAIAAGARIIIYNNPSLKLDMREREVFNQDILRTQKKGISQIIISSQQDSLDPVCGRTIQLEEGEIVK